LIVTSYKGGHKGKLYHGFILGMSNVPKIICKRANQSGSLQQQQQKKKKKKTLGD
jgi:hypothetical protein